MLFKSYSPEELLFILMDQNFKKYFSSDNVFWRSFHAIDQEITPNCMRMETYNPPKTKHKHPQFHRGQETIVVRLLKEKTTHQAVELLTKVFRGTGVEFVAEKIEEKGEVIHQIRSNIDKSNWEKLSVFLKYRFDREIPVEERAEFGSKCQTTVNEYIRGTDCKKWDALPGIPAFCSLMGLHGLLRPKDPYPFNVSRKNTELNKTHHWGTPNIFEDIVIHVHVNKKGEVSGLSYGFDTHAAAFQQSVEGRLFNLIMEGLGGDPFAHSPLANRALRAMGLGLGVSALSHGHFDPAIILCTGIGGMVVGYCHKRWRYYGRLSELEAEREKFQAALLEQIKSQPTAGVTLVDVEKEAFSANGIADLQKLIEDEIRNERPHVAAIRHLAKKPSSAENHMDALLLKQSLALPLMFIR